MSKPDPLVYCICCGNDKPSWDFAPGRDLCSLCMLLPPDAAVKSALEARRRADAAARNSKQGRKAARIAAKLEMYSRYGKRCSACHHPKPAEDYDSCAPQPDGLQPNCRACNKLWRLTVKSGGVQAWHIVRAALRATSPEGK